MNARGPFKFAVGMCAALLAFTLAACGAPENGPDTSQDTAVVTPAADAEIAKVTTIAYLGPEGTYTEEATKLFFGADDELLPQETVDDALARVVSGEAAYAVIPQENALGGPVTEYIDALLATDGAEVVGEVVLPIRQTLMGLSGTDLAAVKSVHSHKQGLAQSAAWLDEHIPDAERVEEASTAAAAQAVADGGDPTAVAIAAPSAADLYGLEVLQENVSQSNANKTRFYVVSREANRLEGYDHALFVGELDAEGLPAALGQATKGGAELVCVHDRPSGTALGNYQYVVELAREGGFTKDELSRIESIDGLTFLGSYGAVE